MSKKQSPQKLPQKIGLIALILYGVGDILGAGIYGLVGKAAGLMGNAVWLAFFVSMVAAGLTGLSYAAVGSRYPRAGGAADVLWRAFRNPFLAFFVGLASLASGLTSMATASRVFSGYAHQLLPALPQDAIIFLFALLLTALVSWGMNESLFANALCTIIELFGLLFIIVVGLPYLGSIDYTDVSTATQGAADLSPSLILSGAVLTFYSFIGFEDMLNVSEEVKNPQKTFPKALLIAVFISSLIYMLISIIAVSVIPAAELAASNAPLVSVVARAAPWFPVKIYNVVALFAVANTALLNFIMGSRLLYGMSRVHLLPKVLSRLHPKRQTPITACIALCVILLLIAYSGDISSLAKATSILLLVCFIFVDIALISLLRKETDAKNAFPVSPMVPFFGAIVCLLMLAHAKTPEWKVAGVLMAIIGTLYFVFRPKQKDIHALLNQ